MKKWKTFGTAALAAMMAVGGVGMLAGCNNTSDADTFTIWMASSVNSSIYNDYGENPVIQYLEKRFEVRSHRGRLQKVPREDERVVRKGLARSQLHFDERRARGLQQAHRLRVLSRRDGPYLLHRLHGDFRGGHGRIAARIFGILARILRIGLACRKAEAEQLLEAAEKLPEGDEKFNMIKGAVFLRRVIDTSTFLSLVMNSGGRLPMEAAQYMLAAANGEAVAPPQAPPQTPPETPQQSS